MFRVKICGITTQADAVAAVAGGAEAVGLNFFAGSRRCVSIESARQIVASLPPGVTKVGLFVNAPVDEIRDFIDRAMLDLIQLHGDETPAFALELGDVPLMRGFRIGPSGLAPAAEWIGEFTSGGGRLSAALLDRYAAGSYGGTGQRLDWDRVAAQRDALAGVRIVLAGGLTAANVASAIDIVRPDAVDVSSGVETAPGVKDYELIRQFTAAAHAAWAATRSS